MDQPEVVFRGRRFYVERSRYRTADGREHTHDSIRHPGAVTIIPLLDDDRVCLIRNYRPTVGQTLIELPAGTLEPGEPPLETAGRELIEETGYRAASIVPVAEFFVSPGILYERMHLFLATGLTAGETKLDSSEQIETLVVPWSEALAMCRDGRIQDAKTLAGLLLYHATRR